MGLGGGGRRTAKIPEIAFTLKSSHFRVGQIAEGFEVFNPAFGVHGRGGGLGKTGSFKERRVKGTNEPSGSLLPREGAWNS